MSKIKNADRIRILIADTETHIARTLSEHLERNGFEARTSTGRDVRQLIHEWKPRFILADLLLPDANALQLLDYIRREHSLRHHVMDLIVLSAHTNEANVRQAIRLGARDFIGKPVQFEDVVQRLVLHSRVHRQIKPGKEKDLSRSDEGSFMLHLTDLVLRQALSTDPLHEILFNLTRMLSLKLEGNRCNIVHCLNDSEGVVVISNDAKSATGIPLNLRKYPEILYVKNTNRILAIENLEQNPALKDIRARVRDINFNSIVVCPVSRRAEPFGVLSLRLPPEKTSISDNEIRFVEIVANTASLVLSIENHKESSEFWRSDSIRAPLPFPLKKVKNR